MYWEVRMWAQRAMRCPMLQRSMNTDREGKKDRGNHLNKAKRMGRNDERRGHNFSDLDISDLDITGEKNVSKESC